jgi:VIT1/CCC1 family predicted Fe2+/Mn2+ transporter
MQYCINQEEAMEIPMDKHKQFEGLQQAEIIGHYTYQKIAAAQPQSENREVLEKISRDEMNHYLIWKKYTGRDVSPNRFMVWFYSFLSRIFGFTFAVKLMENSEEKVQVIYASLLDGIPEVKQILADEEEHEKKLLGMLDEERLQYASSMVLGLSDALVELTGALAGFTLALQNVQLIALSGLITGVAAALSMASSEYLSTRAEKSEKKPGKAALYTGVAYIITVALLILPYLLLKNVFLCLAIVLVTAIIIIAVFNYYIAVAKGENFRKRFLEMAGLSLGVAALSFIISYFIRMWLGINV